MAKLLMYTNPDALGSFGGVENLRRYSGQSRRAVGVFLAGQDAYTLHKPTRARFPRRRTFVKGIADLYQVDLVDLSNISTFNDGYRYLLNVIDVFTKHAWSVPLKTKRGAEVAGAFEKILSEFPCNMVQGDKGTEFLNNDFQTMLIRYDVKFYTSENEDIKCAVVERFNRTLKEKMYRYFTANNTRRYLDVLPKLISTYNRTYHRSIGMAPVDVTHENEQLVRVRLFPVKDKRCRWKFPIGHKVRISMQRLPFRKGYLGHWSEEIFIVKNRLCTLPVTYELADLKGESIKGRFYEPELQLISKEDDALFDIEKIIRTTRRGGKVRYLVKWRGYDSSHNSWVDALSAI